MRCFYLLIVLYINCECSDDRYGGYDDKGLSVSNDDYNGDSGSDDKGYIGDKQDGNKSYDDKRNDQGYRVTSGGKVEKDKDMKNYDINDKENYDNNGYDKKNNNKKFGVGFYGYENKRNYDTKDDDKRNHEKQYDGKGYSGNEHDDKHKNIEKCRYVGPLYDYRKLDTFKYQSNHYNIEDIRRDNINSYDYNNGRYYDYKYDNKCEQGDDNKKDVTRLCSLTDWECIRKYLAAHSGCKPAYGPSPDPFIIPVDMFFIPAVNLTITHTNLKVTGFQSAKITEFYLNKETGNLVIAIAVVNFTQSSPKTFFTYQRKAKEPIVLADFSIVQYNRITFTAVLPYYPHLRLDKAEIHAYVDDNKPTYAVGPGIFNSTDPDVVTTFAQFNLNIPTIIQEAFIFQSFLLTATYIQKSICDFGIDVYGNYLRFLRTKGFVISPNNDNNYNDKGKMNNKGYLN